MKNILLSICVPTYNRPERIFIIVKQVISIPNEEIEIVISDDNTISNRTKEIVHKFKDQRIRYFKNRKNLGYDANVLLTIKRSRGEFIFLLMDDDDIEIETIPWILKIIKENKNITQLRGTIGDKRSGARNFYYKFEDKILKRGSNSLTNLLFENMHGSGIVLRKKALNLSQAGNSIGSLIIQDNLTAQAMIKGDTICTSKIFAYIGKVEYKSQQPNIIKGKDWLHPNTALTIAKFRINIIYNISKGRLREVLLNRQKRNIFLYLCRIYSYESFDLLHSIKSFIKGIEIVLSIKKISRSPKFWICLIYRLLFICPKIK